MMQHKDRLSDEDRKARRLESARKYREANREKAREASRLSQAKRRLESQAVRDADKAYKQTDGYKEQQRRYRAENRERLSAMTMAWQRSNLAKFKEYQKNYRNINAASISERVSRWRDENSERERARIAKWAKDHPERRRLSTGARRARLRNQCGVVTKDIFQRLLKLQRGKCAVCRTSLSKSGSHIDHVMPLKLGGLHDDANMQLLCPRCNISKHAQHPVEYMQKKGFLL